MFSLFLKDGTDMYWARSRVVEYLQTIAGASRRSPSRYGPDVRVPVGSMSTRWSITAGNTASRFADPSDWHLRIPVGDCPRRAEVATIGGFVRQYQVQLDPNKLLAYGIPLSTVIDRVKFQYNEVGGRVLELSGTRYMIRASLSATRYWT